MYPCIDCGYYAENTPLMHEVLLQLEADGTLPIGSYSTVIEAVCNKHCVND